MDFGQQRQQNQQNARSMMYQNPGYQFERRDQKTLILDVADDATTEPLGKAEEFSVDLFEPLIIDKLSNIYLDSFMTHNSSVCGSGNTMAFSLQINEFNVNSNSASSASNQNMYNKIIIPNDHSSVTEVHSCVVHKGKKLNYVCSINPTTLSKISGKITNLVGNSIFGHGTGNPGTVYYVSLVDPVTTHISKETVFGFDAGVSPTTGTTGFRTVFEMLEGSTDLYFHINGIAQAVDADFVSGAATRETGSSTAGLNSLTVNTSTYRKGDYPRFIAEFVIISRD